MNVVYSLGGCDLGNLSVVVVVVEVTMVRVFMRANLELIYVLASRGSRSSVTILFNQTMRHIDC